MGVRAQLKLSFGMIFSIILIVIFIGFAFYAINIFLDLQKETKIGIFVNGFQKDVDAMWRSSQGSQKIPYNLPGSVDLICITDYNSGKSGSRGHVYDELQQEFSSTQNLFFYPLGSGGEIKSKTINHIDVEKITASENPFCFQNVGGKVEIVIKKDFDEALVNIARS